MPFLLNSIYPISLFMNRILSILLVLLVSVTFSAPQAQAQGDVKAKRVNRIDELTKEAKSMFRKNTLSGVKIFRLKGDSYMLSFGSVPVRGSMTTSSLDRMAQAQARKEVMKYNDGITVTEEMIIETEEVTEEEASSFRMSMQETLTESGTSVVSGMQTLCTFQEDDVYVHVLYYDLNGLDTKREKRKDRKD